MMLNGHWMSVIVTLLISASGFAQTTTRVSVDSSGTQGNSISGYYGQSISSDGRYVAFVSNATNLAPGDANGVFNVFVRDQQGGTTESVSVDSSGMQGSSHSYRPSISADGRYVAFDSLANNLHVPDTNGDLDVFVRDRQLGTTERVSVATGGAQGNSGSDNASISADGRYVAFASLASTFVPGDTNGTDDVFVHDRQLGTTERVSVDAAGAQGNGSCHYPSISADGRYVVFESDSTNLVLGDTNGRTDVFFHDRQSGATELVSVATGGAQGNGNSEFPFISAEGRNVAFFSYATDLVPGDANGMGDVFVRDRLSGTTERVSLGSAGAQGNGDSGLYAISISADCRFVAFASNASNLISGDANFSRDVFLRDRQSGTTERVSVDSVGAEGNGGSGDYGISVSADGRFLAFPSYATNLVAGDTNGSLDVFVRDRGPSPPFTISAFCFGDGTDAPCPCGNTGLPGRGCDNSVATGGTLLEASGNAVLSNDTLHLISSHERPSSFSLFWQGGTEVAQRVFGDGLGCMGAPLRRLFFHNAIGGTATAPQGSDLSVSARSAALGDPIATGAIRVYHVFYRDPDVGFCDWPLGSTFNVSNGLRVTWGG